MAEFLGLGLALGVLPIATGTLNRLKEFGFNSQTYGTALAVYLAVSSSGDVIMRVRHYVIGKDLEHARLVKKSFTESFTMIAVAGAIVAQIAFTGLSLEHIRGTH